jgi:Ni/Fe-hydrogenase subunit HybB-like protein
VHPLYQSQLLPLLFLTSTIGMGLSAVTLEGAISSMGLKRPFEKEILAKLLQVGRLLSGLYLVVRFGDLVYRGAIGRAFEPSIVALMFWVEVFLFSVPLWLLASAEARRRSGKLFLSAMALALAGVLYRLDAFLVAYDTGKGWHYFPSLGEMAVTFGLVSFEVVGIIIAIRLLPILPAAEPEPRTP